MCLSEILQLTIKKTGGIITAINRITFSKTMTKTVGVSCFRESAVGASRQIGMPQTYHFRVEDLKVRASKGLRDCCVNAQGLMEPHEWRLS